MTAIEYRGQKVITTEMLAQVYGTAPDRITQNFNANKNFFENAKHYFALQGDDLKAFKRYIAENALPLDVSKYAPKLYLWTERGANRHCKILDTDKAWEQFDNLEETYFRMKSGCLNPSGERILFGEVACFIRTVDKIMVAQGSSPYMRASMAETVAIAGNIRLPAGFVEPSYEQMRFEKKSAQNDTKFINRQ